MGVSEYLLHKFLRRLRHAVGLCGTQHLLLCDQLMSDPRRKSRDDVSTIRAKFVVAVAVLLPSCARDKPVKPCDPFVSARCKSYAFRAGLKLRQQRVVARVVLRQRSEQ